MLLSCVRGSCSVYANEKLRQVLDFTQDQFPVVYHTATGGSRSCFMSTATQVCTSEAWAGPGVSPCGSVAFLSLDGHMDVVEEFLELGKDAPRPLCPHLSSTTPQAST